jgi:hypothetical protein
MKRGCGMAHSTTLTPGPSSRVCMRISLLAISILWPVVSSRICLPRLDLNCIGGRILAHSPSHPLRSQRAHLVLQEVFAHNILAYGNGHRGAVNCISTKKTLDVKNPASVEVCPGVNYMLAATMLAEVVRLPHV